jgi:hypothetical protein
VTKLQAGEFGFQNLVGGTRFFFFSKMPSQALGPTQPHFNGYWGSFLEVRLPQHEHDHSPKSTVEVKNDYNYSSTPRHGHWQFDIFLTLTTIKNIYVEILHFAANILVLYTHTHIYTMFSRSTDPATYDFKYLPSEISGPE